MPTELDLTTISQSDTRQNIWFKTKCLVYTQECKNADVCVVK